MRRELDSLERTPLVVVTSLAIGADQLLAQLAIERGGRIYAILPFDDIERSFAPADILKYRALVQHATVEVVPWAGTDENAYLAAGRRVVELSDLVFAVWDGKPAKGRGGTGDIVAYALARGVPIVHIDPIKRTVTRPAS